MRRLFVVLALGVLCSAVRAQAPLQVEGVKGTVISPVLVAGKLDYTRVSKPSTFKGQPQIYEATVGDLVELEYRFVRASPGGKAAAKKASGKVTGNGAVVKSDLGVRYLDDDQITEAKVVFFYVAKKAGKDTITLDIDGAQYEYIFQVAEAK